MTKATEPYTGPIVTRAQAIAEGLPRYFTGKACRKGHLAERLISSWACSACSHERYIADYATNKDKYREQSARWAAEHPERMAELQKKWVSENPDRADAHRKKWRSDEGNQEKERLYRQRTAPRSAISTAKWRAENPEKELEKQRRWREANPEKARAKVRKWQLANPEKTRVHVNNRRARLICAEGTHTADEILDLFAKQKGKCCYCHIRITLKRRQPNTATEDHWIALSDGGRNDIANIKLSCKSCNSKKGSKDPLVYARLLGRLL